MKITFWRNNRVDQEHQVETETIIRDFIGSTYKGDNGMTNIEMYEAGAMFSRLLLNFMSSTYGSFDRLTEEQWDALNSEFDKQYKPATT